MNRVYAAVAALVLVVAALIALNVSEAATVDSQLSWSAPDTRVDGTPLDVSEIAEYRVYQSVDGTVDKTLPYTVVADGTAEFITVQLDPRAEPYDLNFAVTVVDTEGRESALSNVVTKTVLVKSTAAPAPPTSIVIKVTCLSGCTIEEVIE